MEYNFTSPLAVFLPRKTMRDKKQILNLNNYRNWMHIISNQIKIAYKDAMKDQLAATVKLKAPITIEFTYWKPSNRRSDRANVLCIHEKFFCDALVEAGWIEDDSDEYLIKTTFKGGDLDRLNPRVDITITEVEAAPQEQASFF
jgi:Holliday junction resolvase RusA-like endonuclease|tara:strand:- start:7423 stop:7854 length:432 start_codon:yes stop_codon:yes gene_type:complete